MSAPPRVRPVTVLTPCYNEEENVRPLYEAVCKIFAAEPGYAHRHLFIDNCSTDGTAKALRALAAEDPRVQVILNSRNFGHIRSGTHALLQATGDAVVCMAADFQDPPDLIPRFLRQWEAGFKVVLGTKESADESGLMYAVRSFYYRLVARMSSVELPRHVTGFGLYDRKFLDVFKRIDDPYPYFRGLVADIGFPIAKVPYRQPLRKFGVTKSNFYVLYDLAMLGITNHSKVPLRLMTMGGFVLSFLSLLMAFGYFVAKLVFWDWLPTGIAPILLSGFFFSSVQLFFLGILGEYIGAIHTQVQKRPLVIEADRLNFDTPDPPPVAAAPIPAEPATAPPVPDQSSSPAAC